MNAGLNPAEGEKKMIVAQYFVEFIFYSFLGWVWESIYCTINEKKWADRGFLFGPICPIYGACVIGASILFSAVPALADPSFPVWGIFIICVIGSAIAEFGTSWVLEKRFNARWWDYSDMPLNIQGRICLPVSLLFGAAGVAIVKWLLPFVAGLHQTIPEILYVIFGLVLAGIFGADFALTEASLSSLLKDVERMHAEFCEKSQANYEKVYGEVVSIETKVSESKQAMEAKVSESKQAMETKVNESKQAMADRVSGAKESLSKLHASRLSFNERRILGSISKFTPSKKRTEDQNKTRLMLTEELKNFAREFKEKRKDA